MRRLTETYQILAVWLLVALAPGRCLSMNDTDAVVYRGIFPVRGGAELCIVSEVVTVTLTKQKVKARRSYEVQNIGPRGTFEIGTIWKRNSASLAPEDCGTITVDGQTADIATGTGYLRDLGSTVAFQEKSVAEISKCLETVDGTVCGQVWSWFEVEFEAGETRRVEINFEEKSKERYFSHQVAEHLLLYSEKFWVCDVVPRIEMRFGLEDHDLELASLIPQRHYAPYSTPPAAVDNGFLVWWLDNYSPKKTKYAYSRRLGPPLSINIDSICNAHMKLTPVQDDD